MTEPSRAKIRLGRGGLLVAVVLLGAVATGWAVAGALDSSVPLDAPTVPGQVVDVRGSSRHNWIKVEYTVPDGRRFSSKTSEFGIDDMTVGRQVVVRYDPEDPEDFAVGQFQGDHTLDWLRAATLGVVTVLTARMAYSCASRK